MFLKGSFDASATMTVRKPFATLIIALFCVFSIPTLNTSLGIKAVKTPIPHPTSRTLFGLCWRISLAENSCRYVERCSISSEYLSQLIHFIQDFSQPSPIGGHHTPFMNSEPYQKWVRATPTERQSPERREADGYTHVTNYFSRRTSQTAANLRRKVGTGCMYMLIYGK